MGTDDEFARIIEQEFDQSLGSSWSTGANGSTIEGVPHEPSADELATESHTPEPELPQQANEDFHLNLYDDDEEYRRIDPKTWTMGPLASAGCAAIGFGVLILVLRLLAGGGSWMGWVTGLSVVAGLVLIIAQAIHNAGDRDDDGTVV